jgi:hypothetical protein
MTMAGGKTKVVYTDDLGNAFHRSMASWAATLCGATAATTEPSLPDGLTPRRRYARITATGREVSFIVPDVTSAMWTDAEGTSVNLDVGVYGSTGRAATLQGRTGERKKAI